MSNKVIFNEFKNFCEDENIDKRTAIDSFMRKKCLSDIEIRDMLSTCYDYVKSVRKKE